MVAGGHQIGDLLSSRPLRSSSRRYHRLRDDNLQFFSFLVSQVVRVRYCVLRPSLDAAPFSYCPEGRAEAVEVPRRLAELLELDWVLYEPCPVHVSAR